MDIKQIEMSVKGLSRARNRGLEQASGEIVVLSDDDCWYPANAFEIIVNAFKKRQCAKIVLSQIFDPEKNIHVVKFTGLEIELQFRITRKRLKDAIDTIAYEL